MRLSSLACPGARPNPSSRWECAEVPELRIVDVPLWRRVKVRQASLREGDVPEILRRPPGRRLTIRSIAPIARAFSCRNSSVAAVVGVATPLPAGTASPVRPGSRKGPATIALRSRVRRLNAAFSKDSKRDCWRPNWSPPSSTRFKEQTRKEREVRRASVSQRERKVGEIDRKVAGILRAIEDGLYGSPL